MCVCGVRFTVDHAMICKGGGFIIQRHNELRHLEARLLKMLCYDAAVEPGSQPVTGEELNRGANQSHDARSDVHARGFWKRQRSAYFDIIQDSGIQYFKSRVHDFLFQHYLAK